MSFIFSHWKLGFHLVFKTRHFGVNNLWWSSFPSLWAWPWWKRILATLTVYPLVQNFLLLRVRLSHSHGWIPVKEYESVFGKKKLYLPHD
jgi:hypothetical protein